MKVVLDACVLIPAALRDTLLRAAMMGLYTVCWSASILKEVDRNLRKLGLSAEQAQSLLTRMKAAFPDAAVVGYDALIDALKNNPKDRHVLAAAIAGRAEVIVTSNLRHFNKEALAPLEIQAVSPDDFLMSLFTQNPRLLVQVVIEQAAALKSPPMTAREVLDQIAVQAPIFAQHVRQSLKE